MCLQMLTWMQSKSRSQSHNLMDMSSEELSERTSRRKRVCSKVSVTDQCEQPDNRQTQSVFATSNMQQ